MSDRAQAVKLTHVPTGIVVKHDEQRTTAANFEAAKRVMQVKLALRNIALLQPFHGTAMRTYDYQNGYVIDHRASSADLYRSLQPFMDGYKTSHLVLRSHLIAALTAAGIELPFQEGNAIIVIRGGR